MKNVFLDIKVSDIVAINKRQMDKDDLNKLSIHYRTNPNNNSIKEVKIRSRTRRETDLWILRLRKMVNPHRYEFVKNGNPLNSILHYFSGNVSNVSNLLKKEPKIFFVKLKKIEFILLRKYKQQFYNGLIKNNWQNSYSFNNNYKHTDSIFLEENYEEDSINLGNSDLNAVVKKDYHKNDEVEHKRNAEELYRLNENENDNVVENECESAQKIENE